jgi:hypothetical protein
LTQIHTEKLIWVYLGDLWAFWADGRKIRNPKSGIAFSYAVTSPKFEIKRVGGNSKIRAENFVLLGAATGIRPSQIQ